MPSKFVTIHTLQQHFSVPALPGWRLAVRGGRKCAQGYEVQHGEVLTLALIQEGAPGDEDPESESNFSEDPEAEDLDPESETDSSTRSRSPREPSKDQDPSSDRSYQGCLQESPHSEKHSAIGMTRVYECIRVGVCAGYAVAVKHDLFGHAVQWASCWINALLDSARSLSLFGNLRHDHHRAGHIVSEVCVPPPNILCMRSLAAQPVTCKIPSKPSSILSPGTAMIPFQYHCYSVHTV